MNLRSDFNDRSAHLILDYLIRIIPAKNHVASAYMPAAWRRGGDGPNRVPLDPARAWEADQA
jgi:hypothetical protein